MSPKVHSIGPLEMEVLGLLQGLQGGDAVKGCSVGDVQQMLKSAGSDLAYTTVMTVLVRLSSKGYLDREKSGRQFVYRLALDSSKRTEQVLAAVGRSLFGNARLRPILALIEDNEELTEDDLRELRKLVDEKLTRS